MALSYEELEHRYALYRGLVEVSSLINRYTELDPLLQAIMETAQRVMGAEASSLMLADRESGELEMVVVTAQEAERYAVPTRKRVPRGRGIAGWVFERGESVRVLDAYLDDRFFPEMDRETGFRTRGILCVPLEYEGKRIGVLQVLNAVGRDGFSEVEQEVFEAYATMAATAIERNRLLDAERQGQRLMQELSFATVVQESFLPCERPVWPGWGVDWCSLAARQIGGDFIDVVEVGEGECFFVIGDVSGKGIPAALLMAQAMSMFRLTLQPGLRPMEVLERWNRLLLERVVRGTFVTAMVGRFALDGGWMELGNAGHCPPVVIRNGRAEEGALFRGSPPLGILPGVTFESCALQLDAGDRLLFYTDGLTETQNGEEGFLDRSGVLGMLEPGRYPERELIPFVVERAAAFRGAEELQDDLTMLLVERR